MMAGSCAGVVGGGIHRRWLPAMSVAVSLCLATGTEAVAEAVPFDLGTVLIVGQRGAPADTGSDQVASSVRRREMERFNRDDVGEALNLLSGVTLSTNSRNERTIAVRGFDSREVPLFIDGIPVYVPYDGYVDYGRFSTADLAAIQVAKGYSSVAYGPNALGGAINLVSRRPTRTFEADVRAGAGSGGERRTSANLGTNQGSWYLQTGAAWAESDEFPLSSDFVSTPTQAGGARNNAYRRDSRLSVKLGLTPNATDEYVLGGYRQEGEKGQPPSTIPALARYWQWPYWDKEGAYFLSRTVLGDAETLAFRMYHDRYDNEVDSYTDGTYTTLRASGRGSVSTGRSIYHDRTSGGSLELESTRFSRHALRLIAHYRSDGHRELDAAGALNAHFDDEALSVSAEDMIRLASRLALSIGLSHHALRPQSVFSRGNAYSLPHEQTATDAQAGLYYDPPASARLYVTVARKSRLPTLKDRYSQRLGTFIENPGLRPEQSLSYEIGYRARIMQGFQAEAAVFRSEITDRIQAVANVAGNISQMRNVGEVRASGLELGLQGELSARLELGGNYTFTDLENRSDPGVRLTDVSRHKLTAHALLRPMRQIEVVAFAEHDSSRWASNTTRLSGFTTLDLKAVWRPRLPLAIEAGVRNLTDRNYALAEGFPSPGRAWLANASCQF